MRSDSGRTTSVWMDRPAISARPRITEDQSADVCVIGAGLAGLTTAYLLGLTGRHVIVIDDGPIAGGETARTTAHLTHVADDRYAWLAHVHGERGAALFAESHTAAIDRIEYIAATEGIECDFARCNAYLFVPPGDPTDPLEAEIEAARRAGILDVSWADRAPLERFETGRCLRFPDQAQFHPLDYLAGLARAIERDGGRIHRETHASDIQDGPPATVVVEGGARIRADSVVVATNSPIHSRLEIHPKQTAYRTYVIAAPVTPGSVAAALYYDTGWPYHYARLHSLDGGERLIVGGEDHETGQANDGEQRWAALAAWARERFPSLGEITHRWSGQVEESVDGVGFIGRDPHSPNLYVVTGDSGMGMTHGTIAGMLLTELIEGRDHPWSALYDPARVSKRTAGRMARHNLAAVGHYVDYLTGGDVDSLEQIAAGQGAIVRHGTHKLAVYRDREGHFHQCSAVCPHLGCIVAWNSAEGTWDCPCHGSRFDATGRVINGPAIGGLAPTEHPISTARNTG